MDASSMKNINKSEEKLCDDEVRSSQYNSKLDLINGLFIAEEVKD